MMNGLALAAITIALLSSCGEGIPQTQGSAYENKVYSVELPAGWTAAEATPYPEYVTFKKSDQSIVQIGIQLDNNSQVEDIVAQTKADPNMLGVVVKNVTIGENSYIQFTRTKKLPLAGSLLLSKGKLLLVITVNFFDGADERKIIESLRLK